MTAVLTSFFRPTGSDYAAVAPHSPGADAAFIHSITYFPFDEKNKHQSRPGTQMSRISYSSEDFNHDGSERRVPTAAAAPTWNDTAFAVGQWTTSAASTVATTIISTTKQLSSQLNVANSNTNNTPSSPKVKTLANTRKVQHGNAEVYGRGINRDYLRGSPHHPDANQAGVVSYIGNLASRITASKGSTPKAKWMD